MRHRLLMVALICLAAIPMAGATDGGESRDKFDKAMAKIYPALVQIYVVTVDYREGREQKFQAAGSGVIISPEGHVITNHHVAGKAKRIRCTLSNKEELEAALMGTDPLADIAVVKLDLSTRRDSKDLPFAKFGDSDKLRVGDRVLAMGCPVALSQSVTMGIVSNKGFTIPKLFWPFTFKLDGEEVGTLVKWIGFDAQIFGGNSGGPLVDLDGKIVGINEIGIGLGGAIPGNLAKDVARQIMEQGQVRRSWIGIRCQPLLKGSKEIEGALIAEVLPGSPAEKVGLLPGDVLLRFNDRALTVHFSEEIPEINQILMSAPVGAVVPLEILRNGQKSSLKVTTALREPARGEERELKAWGITARQISELAAKELLRNDKTGVYVWSVRPGGPAGEAKPAIQSEDVIVNVAGTPIQGLQHLEEVTERLIQGQTKAVPVVVIFERRKDRLFTVAKLGAKEEEERPREVNKAWLPAAYQVLARDLAEGLKLKGTTGVVITQVYPKSEAEEGGLKTGDIVTHLDGQPIAVSQPEEIEIFAQMIRQYKIGTQAEFTVLRGPENKPVKLQIKLAERPKPEGQVKNHKDEHFDFEARDLTYMDRVKEGWEQSQTGAMVVAVQPGGWAMLAHLGVGDLILSIDGAPIANVTELTERMKKIAEVRPRHVSIFVKRGIHTNFIEIEPSWPVKK